MNRLNPLRSWRALRVGLLALALAATVGAAAAPAARSAGAAAASPARAAAGETCLSAPARDRVRVGSASQGDDPNTLTAGESARAQRDFEARARARGLTSRSTAVFPSVVIDVHVHVITRNDGTGGVTRDQVKRQMAVLNTAYAGKLGGRSSQTIFRFRTVSVDFTRNSSWYSWSDPDVDPSDDTAAKRALHKGGTDDLNLYLPALEDGLLGYATFPSDRAGLRDGVVLLNESLPGGDATPYNLGDTATHEVGHWLGLLHTFQGGCSATNDGVADTPAQADGENVFSCVESLDTCPATGKDPVHNYMSYGDDACLDRFSKGQATRMAQQWYAYRSSRSLA